MKTQSQSHIDDVVNRVADLVMTELQKRLSESVAKVGSAATPAGTSSSSFTQTLTALFHPPSMTGLLEQLASLVREQSPSRVAGHSTARSRQAPPANPPRPGLFSRIADWWGQRQAQANSGANGLGWWSRGGGNKPGGGKRSAISRVSRLKVLAQRRYDAANRAVIASTRDKKSPGWHPAAHGKLLAARRAAAQKLGQATALQARATSLSALAGGRVASALTGLAGKLPMLAGKVAGPVGMAASAAVEVAKLPFRLSKLNDDRIESLREGGRYHGAIAAALARYDTKTENHKALNARDTADSTSWLVDEHNKLRTALRPFQSMLQNSINYVQAGATWGLNKYIEFEQTRMDYMQGFGKELMDLIPGMGGDRSFDLAGITDHVKKMATERERKAKEDEKVFSMQMSKHLEGWAVGTIGIGDARRNNIPKRQMHRIRG